MSDIWTGVEPTHDSPYYPFKKTVEADTLAGCENIPYIMCKYLMDLPDGTGYVPPSDNKYPRARLKKLLYWDCPLPLNQPLPTTEQMMSIMFDPENPDKPSDPERGYRIFPQNTVSQAMHRSGSRIRCYLSDGSVLETRGTFVTRQDVIIDVVVNVGIESNMKMTASSRAFNIVQAIKEATAGVNFGGVGCITTRRITKIDDEKTYCGYKIYQYIDWYSDAPNKNFC